MTRSTATSTFNTRPIKIREEPIKNRFLTDFCLLMKEFFAWLRWRKYYLPKLSAIAIRLMISLSVAS